MDTKLFLKAGDILLYRPVKFSFKRLGTIFSNLITLKTWHRISHVEIYDGGKLSLASRDGQGVGRYPFRGTELAYVLRPQVSLDLAAGRRYFESIKGMKYGWLDLGAFEGLSIDAPGIVCSPFATAFLRAAGWNVFPTDPINKVAPFQFLDLVGPELLIAYGPADLKEMQGTLASLVPSAIDSLS